MLKNENSIVVTQKRQSHKTVSFSPSKGSSKKSAKKVKKKSRFSSKQLSIGLVTEDSCATQRSEEHFQTFISPRQENIVLPFSQFASEERISSPTPSKKKKSPVCETMSYASGLVKERLSKIVSILSFPQSPVSQKDIKSILFAISTFERLSRPPDCSVPLEFPAEQKFPLTQRSIQTLKTSSEKRKKHYSAIFNSTLNTVEDIITLVKKAKRPNPLKKLKERRRGSNFLLNINITTSAREDSFTSDATLTEHTGIKLPLPLVRSTKGRSRNLSQLVHF